MDYNYTFAVARAGMAVEQTRLDVATQNLAHMNQPIAPGAQGFQPLRVTAVATQANNLFASTLVAAKATQGGVSARIEPQATPPRLVHEPSHPFADANGYVAYPAVDHTAEMVNLMTAMRAYEANVVAFNTAKTMAQRALDIGGNS